MHLFEKESMSGCVHRLKRPIIWLKRFRYRRGYGVHSPFAFDFITNVIYEKTPYYAYEEIEQKQLEKKEIQKKPFRSKKKDRLLFRLVNRMQPSLIIDAGCESDSDIYLQSGKRNATYIPVVSASDFILSHHTIADFLYIRYGEDIDFVKEIWRNCIHKAGQHSMFVLEGIHYSTPMKAFWKQCIADDRVGITFDLYDFGILFFDKKKLKQHYIVNF